MLVKSASSILVLATWLCGHRRLLASALLPPSVMIASPHASSTAPVSVEQRHFYRQELSHQPVSKAHLMNWMQTTLTVPPVWAMESLPPSQSLSSPPTKEEVALLREAFAAFYGTARDYGLAERLLTQSIEAWQRQSPDEQAGLYRVRGDCQMALLQPSKAIDDYTKALDLLRISTKADPSELPAS